MLQRLYLEENASPKILTKFLRSGEAPLGWAMKYWAKESEVKVTKIIFRCLLRNFDISSWKLSDYLSAIIVSLPDSSAIKSKKQRQKSKSSTIQLDFPRKALLSNFLLPDWIAKLNTCASFSPRQRQWKEVKNKNSNQPLPSFHSKHKKTLINHVWKIVSALKMIA